MQKYIAKNHNAICAILLSVDWDQGAQDTRTFNRLMAGWVLLHLWINSGYGILVFIQHSQGELLCLKHVFLPSSPPNSLLSLHRKCDLIFDIFRSRVLIHCRSFVHLNLHESSQHLTHLQFPLNPLSVNAFSALSQFFLNEHTYIHIILLHYTPIPPGEMCAFSHFHLFSSSMTQLKLVLYSITVLYISYLLTSHNRCIECVSPT